ncbi:MAG: NAD(P)-binding domain-containing protein [Acidimicrobiia bacterium]
MKDACIIGAGASGLASAKALLDQGVSFDWFELGSGIGGNWRYGNDNGRSPAYASLQVDTSKDRMAFADLPIPDDWPTYLHHSEVLHYLEQYAGRFGLVGHCTFRSEVTNVVPEGGDWLIAVRSRVDGSSRTTRYRTVVVASGHHWKPIEPGWPGEFTGTRMHASSYRTPDVFEGRRVLVVGIGNSGADIASEAVGHAASVSLSTRRGAHVIPRYILGRATDQWTSPAGSWLPLPLQRVPYRALLWLSRGRQRGSGIPVPPNRLLEEHPTVSQELLPLVRGGRIAVRPDVERLDGDRVVFVDGRSDLVDVLVTATGYEISFPFLDREVLEVRDNELGLFRRVVHPELPGLYFVGLIQPLGAIMPLAEAQAGWVARLARGAPPPPREAMRASIENDRLTTESRYVASRRHTIQVDYWPYLNEMRAAIREADRVLGVAS